MDSIQHTANQVKPGPAFVLGAADLGAEVLPILPKPENLNPPPRKPPPRGMLQNPVYWGCVE
jgi:hypothetical protein